MRTLLGSAFLLGLVVVPTLAEAQRRGAAQPQRKEFGVDIGIAYAKPENVDGGIVIGTPIDVRVGLPSRGKIMWEPRVTLDFSTVGGETAYLFTPGVNALYAMDPTGHTRGMFLTGGGGLLLGDFGVSSGTAFSLNGGVGWRKPWGTGAYRYELGFRYTFESQDLGIPSTIEIGARVGISLWR